MFGAATRADQDPHSWSVDPELLRLFALVGLLAASAAVAGLAAAMLLMGADMPANALPILALSMAYALVFLAALFTGTRSEHRMAARVMVWGAWASSIVYGFWVVAQGLPTLWLFLLVPILLAATFATPRDVLVMGFTHLLFLSLAPLAAGLSAGALVHVHVANGVVTVALVLNAMARVRAVRRYREARDVEAATRRDLSRVLDTIDEGVLVYDSAQRIRVCNDAGTRLYRQLFGIDLKTSPVLPHGASRNGQTYRQILALHSEEERVLDLRDVDGRQRSLAVINTNWGPSGRHNLLLVRDRGSEQIRETEVTHRARVESLETLLEKVAKERERFETAAGHFIGSPVAAMRLQLDLLESRHVTPEVRRSVLVLRRNVERIEDALRNLQGDDGPDRWVKMAAAQPTPVAEVARRRLATYKPVLESKGVEGEVTGDQDAVWAQDPDLVEAALDSLLYAAVSDVHGQERLEVRVQADARQVVVERHHLGEAERTPEIPPSVDVERGVRVADRVASACGGALEMQPMPKGSALLRRFVMSLPERAAPRPLHRSPPSDERPIHDTSSAAGQRQ